MGISIQGLSVGHKGYKNGVDGWYSGPNSAGGVSVTFGFTNTGSKTIKYADFYFIPYNAVGDAVGCRTRRVSETSVQYTGPLGPGQSCTGAIFSNAWYNNTIRSVKVSKVVIQYTNGTEETIKGSDIQLTAGRPGGGSGGCYVATAVYGSYDCPQVWTLRRYRDYDLAETWYGRAFVHTYYAISPTLVKWFGNTEWFKKMWRGKLDRMVKNLQDKGYESTPYEDRNW